jgi:hypothetical protein
MRKPENILERLYNNFETTHILDAVDILDKTLRTHLSDGSRGEPSIIRDALLKLHKMVFAIVNGSSLKIREIVELANDIEYTLDEVIEAAERIRNTITELTDLVGNDCYEEDEA